LFEVLSEQMDREPGQLRALLEADFERSGQKGRLEFDAPRLEVVSSVGTANKRQRQHHRNSA
jgi:hypothetical protein